MENNTTTKAEMMKPVLLKAGIPLAITVAGFVFAKLTQRIKHSTLETSSQIKSDHVNSTEKTDSQSRGSGYEEIGTSHFLESHEEEEEDNPSLQNSDAKIDKYEIESSRILEMKEQEVIHNMLSMENSRVELLEREISALEAERVRLETIGIGYLKTVKVLAISGLENRLLRKRVKKLLKKIKQQSHVIKEQSLQIEAKEKTEILSNIQQFESGPDMDRKLEVEIEEMKFIATQLQIDKNELLNQIESANKTISSKIEEEEAIKASYDRVVSEMEKLEKERAVEAKELVYLRWCNACLRHELLRRNQEQRTSVDDREISDIPSDDEIDYSRSEHAHHKKAKIIQKLKRWMDGHEKSQAGK